MAGPNLPALLERALEQLPEGTEADARLTHSRWGTMRFANGRIHQPHLESSIDLSLRVLMDGRLATATTADLRPEGIAAAVRHAVSLARVAPREPRFPGFPRSGRPSPRKAPFSESTARLSPEAEGRLAQDALDGAHATAPGARVSGVVNVGTERLFVGNSAGLRRETRRSAVQASVLVERPEADPPVSGWAEVAHWRASEVDLHALGVEAADRMAKSPPKAAPPGSYRVLLAGAAVTELLGSLGYLGFGGHAEAEGWSCLRARRGKRVFPESVTLEDDAVSSWTLPTSVDYEGLPKRRTGLIEKGVVQGPVTDLVTAGRLGVESSGHALPPESPYGDWGPVPTNMLLRAGDARLPELIRETRRGLLVTRFHYVRVVHPGKGILTGMTRDGTYRIERGEVVAPVRNLRFTQSAVDAVRDVELVGRERRRYSDERGFSSITTPALVIGRFRFTSATVF